MRSRTTRHAALALLLLAGLGAPRGAGATEAMGQAAEGRGEDEEPANARVLPVDRPDAQWTFRSNPRPVKFRSPHFDVGKDTPAFVNKGTVVNEGGTCYGMNYLTQIFYERVVYRFLGLGLSVYRPEWGLPNIPEGDTDQFERHRAKAWTRTDAGKFKWRRLATSMHANRDHGGAGNVWAGGERGTNQESYNVFLDALRDPRKGLGLMWFNFESSGAHAVALFEMERGTAVDPATNRRTPAAKFRIYDNTEVFESEQDNQDHFVVYFYRSQKFSFSPGFRDSWGRNNLQRGNYVQADNIGHYAPYGRAARRRAETRDTTAGRELLWGGVTEDGRSAHQYWRDKKKGRQ